MIPNGLRNLGCDFSESSSYSQLFTSSHSLIFCPPAVTASLQLCTSAFYCLYVRYSGYSRIGGKPTGFYHCQFYTEGSSVVEPPGSLPLPHPYPYSSLVPSNDGLAIVMV